MKKETVSLVDYLHRTPLLHSYIKDILAITPQENLELSPDSLFRIVKECVAGIHSAGNMLLNKVHVTIQKKIIILILGGLASLCAIIDDIANSENHSIVVPNFVQQEFIDLINKLRSLAIVVRDYSNAADVADEILQITLSLIVPFYTNNLIVAHPIVHNNKQSLSETNFLYSHIHINNIVKFMHTCHAKIYCDRGDVDLAMRSLILSQIAHEASRLEMGKLVPMKTPKFDQTETLRQQFKRCDNWRSAKLQHYMPFKDNRNFSCDQSYVNALIYMMKDFENLELAECFLDMGEKILIMPSSEKDAFFFLVSIPAGYEKLSEMLRARNDISREVRCLIKAKKCYERMLQRIQDGRGSIEEIGRDIKSSTISYKKHIADIKGRLFAIKKIAFKTLSNEWAMLADRYTASCNVTFDLENISLAIECQDAVFIKGLLRQLRHANIPAHCNNAVNKISINEPAEITINVLERCFKRTQHDLLARRRRIEMALKAKSEAPAPVPKVEAERELSLPGSALLAQYKNHTKMKPNKKTKPKTENPTPPVVPVVVAIKPTLPDIDWGEDFPKFSYGNSQVYAFPNPEINTNAMIKGMFFGYIDVDQLQDLDEELLKRFEEQLALGALSNEDKAQGIRPITSNEANNTDYLYKINIGREDLRLYGRKVAIIIVDDSPRTLICFDQTLPHNKKLKQLQTETINHN